MLYRRYLANNKLLRRLLFPLLRKLNFDSTFSHDYTRRRFRLRTWDHKGYWFYGRRREFAEIAMFEELINPDDFVLEIGAHIGYVTQIFEELVGSGGKVVAVEPTEASARYLRENIRHDTTILPMAIADRNGEMDFYVETCGGFTNTLITDFALQAQESLHKSGIARADSVQNTVRVPVRTVDTICAELGMTPEFVKIDVEGAELSVIRGATSTLPHIKAMMIEVGDDFQAIIDLCDEYGFDAFDATGVLLGRDSEVTFSNIFFIRRPNQAFVSRD